MHYLSILCKENFDSKYHNVDLTPVLLLYRCKVSANCCIYSLHVVSIITATIYSYSLTFAEKYLQSFLDVCLLMYLIVLCPTLPYTCICHLRNPCCMQKGSLRAGFQWEPTSVTSGQEQTTFTYCLWCFSLLLLRLKYVIGFDCVGTGSFTLYFISSGRNSSSRLVAFWVVRFLH